VCVAFTSDERQGVEKMGQEQVEWLNKRTIWTGFAPIEDLFEPGDSPWRVRKRNDKHTWRIAATMRQFGTIPTHASGCVHWPEAATRLRKNEDVDDLKNLPNLYQILRDKTGGIRTFKGDHSREALSLNHQTYPSQALYKGFPDFPIIVYDENNAEDCKMLRAIGNSSNVTGSSGRKNTFAEDTLQVDLVTNINIWF